VGWTWVWANRPGTTRAPSRHAPAAAYRLAGEQSQEVRLSGPVRAENADPLAIEDLRVERPHEPDELQAFADHCAHAGPPAAQPHRDPLLGWLVRRRSSCLESLEPADHDAVLSGHSVADFRLLLQRAHQLDQPGVFLLPPTTQLGHPFVLGRSGLVIGRKPAAVHPDGRALNRDDPVGNLRE
jgi:hypothetical protein